MNERIEGIWWKARIGYNNQNCDPEVLSKFAQLIVQECMEQVITGPNGPAHYAVEAALRLKKHFGVEE